MQAAQLTCERLEALAALEDHVDARVHALKDVLDGIAHVLDWWALGRRAGLPGQRRRLGRRRRATALALEARQGAVHRLEGGVDLARDKEAVGCAEKDDIAQSVSARENCGDNAPGVRPLMADSSDCCDDSRLDLAFSAALWTSEAMPH